MISEDLWLKKLEAIIATKLDDSTLDNQYLAYEMGLSERQFHRKTKASSGFSPNHFIRTYRLKKAMEFITKGQYLTVQEVALHVGYQNTHYFSKVFLAEHGESPMEVLKRLKLR